MAGMFSVLLLFLCLREVDGFSVLQSPPKCRLALNGGVRRSVVKAFRSSGNGGVRLGGRGARLSIKSSSGDDDNGGVLPKKKRRRRRKDVVGKEEENAVAPSSAPVAIPELKPRDDTPVELTIQDVRDVVSGNKKGTSKETNMNQVGPEDEDDDDDEYEYYYEGAEDSAVDSLEQLLADARQMREDRDKEEEDGFSIPDSVRNVISTIVTIDFFVVCALLVWFLTGIFGSYVLKNDAIQIAFNGIFQPVVQPALGILMIGSAAGAVFKKEEDET
jgi:hypothetical protein